MRFRRLPRQLSIYERFIVGYGITTVLFLLSTIYSGITLQKLSNSASLERRISEASRTAYELELEVLRGIIALADVAHGLENGDARGLDRIRNNTRTLTAQLRRQTDDPLVIRELDAFDALFAARWALADSMVTAFEGGAAQTTVMALRARRNELDTRARQNLRAILAAQQVALKRSSDADERLRENAQARMTLVWALNLAFVLMIAALLPRLVRRKLKLLFGMTRRIASGDYSARVEVRGNDELDRFGRNLNKMAAQLDELEKVKSEFLALASHQLRTPATGVKGNLGMLIEGYCGEVTEEQREILEDAYASNERQLAIIDDMLAVARVEAGKLTLINERVDLGELLESVVAEQRSTITSRQQSAVVERPRKPMIINADAQRLRMVLENLVSNASKYSFTGGTVAVILKEEPGWVRVDVSDTGVGIDEKDLHKLYKKFSRLDNPLSRSVSGTGLGLYLAYEIVRLHGGAITAASAPGKGTTFTVRLPIGEKA